MLKQISFIYLYTFLLIFLIFCKGKDSLQKKEAENDTNLKNRTTLNPSSSIPSDTDFLKKIGDLNTFFDNRSTGQLIDQTKSIPFSIISNFLSKDDYDTASFFYLDVNPIFSCKNYYGSFFIVKVNCTAGAICATYYLLRFDKQDRFVKNDMIGEETSEESKSYELKYRIIGDTILQVYKIQYNNIDDKVIDSVKTEIKLSLPQ